jgi:hypothetical protein
MFDSWPFWLEEEEEERTTTFCALIPSGASRAGRFRAWCKFSNRPIQRRRKRNGHVMSALPPFVYDLLAGTVLQSGGIPGGWVASILAAVTFSS